MFIPAISQNIHFVLDQLNTGICKSESGQSVPGHVDEIRSQVRQRQPFVAPFEIPNQYG